MLLFRDAVSFLRDIVPLRHFVRHRDFHSDAVAFLRNAVTFLQ
jgi:hypothetical protein